MSKQLSSGKDGEPGIESSSQHCQGPALLPWTNHLQISASYNTGILISLSGIDNILQSPVPCLNDAEGHLGVRWLSICFQLRP